MNTHFLFIAAMLTAASLAAPPLWVASDVDDATALAVRKGTLFVGTHGGRLIAFDDSGTRRWETALTKEEITSISCDDRGGIWVSAETLYKVSERGARLWRYSAEPPGVCIPAIGKTLIYAIAPYRFLQLKSDTTVERSVKVSGWADFGPVIDSRGNAYILAKHIGRSKPNVTALSTDGTLMWKTVVEDPLHSPALTNQGAVVVSTMKGITLIQPDGRIAWVFNPGAAATGTVAITDRGSIIVGLSDARVCAVSNQGKLAWEQNVGAAVMSSPVADKRGHVYVINAKGQLLDVSSEGVSTVAKVRLNYREEMLLDENGNLFVPTRDGIMCFSVPAGVPASGWPLPRRDPAATGSLQ